MDRNSKIHIIYLSIIFIIISLGCIVLAGYDQEAFVNQFSFASTITSIVLSVVAIWMSISGERGTNDIKNRMEEIVNRLSVTTDDAKEVTQNYEEQFQHLERMILSLPAEVNKGIAETIFPRDAESIPHLTVRVANSVELIKKMCGCYNLSVLNTVIFILGHSDYDKTFVSGEVFNKVYRLYKTEFKGKINESHFGVAIAIVVAAEVYGAKNEVSEQEMVHLVEEIIKEKSADN